MSEQGRAADGENEEERRAREAAERSYVEGLIARGEAAQPDEHGNLPPGATHEIVEWKEGELPKLRRRRFSAGS
jgi:hypothetical protein